MVREKRDMRPPVLKFAAAVLLSLGGLLFTFLRNESSKPSSDTGKSDSCGDRSDNLVLQKTENSAGLAKHDLSPPKSASNSFSPRVKVNGVIDSYILPEFDEVLTETNSAGEDMNTVDYAHLIPKEYTYLQKDGSGNAQEIQRLRQTVQILKERETDLEIQLLEYYGLKEQETAFMELQNQLKIKHMEARLFSLKLESLQADKKRLEEQVSDHTKVSAELDAAKAQIKILMRKLKSEAEENKERILALQERARKLQEEEKMDVEADHGNIQGKLQKLRDLEEEMEELRKSNSTLMLEKSELAQKLEHAQLLATSVLSSDEERVLKEEPQSLQQKYENLTKEVEQLQAARCSDVEELVYLRWLNACLRYELRNHKPSPDATVSRDLSRTLSPKSEEKVKQLILEYASKEGQDEKGKCLQDFDSDQWFTSQNSSHTDSEDDSSIDMSLDSKTHASKRPQVFGKLMRLLQGKARGKDNRSTSGETSLGVEDLERRQSGFSAGIDSVSDRADNRFSSELRRTSDDGPTLCIFRSTDAIAEDNYSTQSDQSTHAPENIQKAELVKYAETLKVSCSISSRRSVFGSL